MPVEPGHALADRHQIYAVDPLLLGDLLEPRNLVRGEVRRLVDDEPRRKVLVFAPVDGKRTLQELRGIVLI
jgi:hypothetical protein